MAEIDLDKIAHNVQEIKKFVKNAELMAVVKANAYGHGAIEISAQALEHGASWLGVATVEEGIELRRAGLTAPILVLGGILPEQFDLCLNYNLDITVSSNNFVKQIKQVDFNNKKKLHVHLKIDTGMGRLGVLPWEVTEFATAVKNLDKVCVRGIWTHFPEAASLDASYSLRQIAVFEQSIRQIEDILSCIPFKHAANSAAIINLPQAHFNLVRAGLGLYGYYDEPHLAQHICLKPALTWRTKITSFREVPPGSSIGYGRTFITKRPTRIANIPVGYADGYNRLLSNKGQVLVKGKRVDIVGRVCMDQTMIDITDLDDIQEGEEVVLLGRQGDNAITMEEMAAWACTIPNDILVSIGCRVFRTYKTAAPGTNIFEKIVS
ncbi:MAG: alanine racemase [Bacillota bacterium]